MKNQMNEAKKSIPVLRQERGHVPGGQDKLINYATILQNPGFQIRFFFR